MELKDIIEILKWSFAAIILALIFRGPLVSLIARVRKIGYGDTGVELKDIVSQKTKDTIETAGEGQPDRIKRTLGLFNEETIKTYRDGVI